MFKRDIINELTNWSKRSSRKPLVLRGARQVGKTTAVQLFAKNFDAFISLNLEKREDKIIFETDYPFKDLVDRLLLRTDLIRNESKILIFIDEIQNSPKAIELLRYFYEEANDLYVIAAGSLLENILESNISFPVGRVEFLKMYPCSFKEYLGAIGEKKLLRIYESEDIPEYTHTSLSDHFKRYTIVGGMPQILSIYADDREISKLQPLFSSLIATYTEDIEKYAKSESSKRYISHIMNSVWNEAGNRITFEKFGNSSYRSREMKEAFLTLEKTLILKLSYPLTSSKLPVAPNIRKKPRLHLCDTGIVNYKLGMTDVLISEKHIDNVYKGKIAEHIIGQELQALSFDIQHTTNFWIRDKKGSDAEVDYILPYKGLLIPIEVKSGTTGTLKSLHQYIDEAPHNIAIRFYSGTFKIENTKTPKGKRFQLINMPHYMAGKTIDVLKSSIKRREV